MFEKHFRKSTDDAIRTVTEDVSVDRVTNWCEHIRTRQVSVSPLGQAMGLPIGPKEVSCSEVEGSYQGMTYQGTAELFIGTHCVGCPYHKLKHPNNIGQAILDSANAEATAEEGDAKKLQKFVVEGINADALLKSDAQSDDEVKTLVGLLADDERKADAAAKLREIARHFPDRISLIVARALTAAFRDPRVGGLAMETVLLLVPHHGNDLLREAAAVARRTAVHVNDVAKIICNALSAGVVTPDAELADELLLQLTPLIEHFEVRRSGIRPDRTAVADAFRRLAELNFEIAAEATGRVLIDESDSYRQEQGAAAVVELLGVDAPHTSVEFVRLLIRGIAVSPGDDETSAALAIALAKCIAASPGPVTDIVFDLLPGLDDSTKVSALTAFLRDESMEGDDHPWVPRLIGKLADEELSQDVRRHLVDHFEHAARRWPDVFSNHFEFLLGTVAQAAQAAEAVRRRLEEPPKTPLEALERESASIVASTSVRDLGKTLAWVSLSKPDDSIAAIDDLLRKTDSGVAGAFKAALLRTLGELGRDAKYLAPRLVPIIHPHLVDPTSHHVRAAALDACEELVRWNRDVLPEDTLLIAASLLGDQYLHPVTSSAVDVFERARVDDPWLASSVARMLYRLYQLHSDDSWYRSSVRSIASALGSLAGQHEFLATPVATILARMSDHKDFYTARDAIQEFRWFARHQVKFQATYADTLINFLERFKLLAGLSGYQYLEGRDEDQFEEFYRLDSDVVRSRAKQLVRFAVESNEERNLLYVATLLVTLGLDEQAADLFDALASVFPDERRNQWRVKKYRGVALNLRAERAVSEGKTGDADELFRQAHELFEQGRPPRRRLPLNLGDVDDEPPFYQEWTELRRHWLDLPDEVDDLEDNAASLAEAVTSLAEHDLEERETVILKMAELLCTAGVRLAQWWKLLRAADPTSGAARDGALACLAEAAEAAEALEGEQGAARIRSILHQAESLTATTGQSGIRNVVAGIRECYLPTPRYSLPVPRDWRRTRRKGAGESQERAASQGQDEVPTMAVASISINGVTPPPVFEAISKRTYDLAVTFRIANVPPQTKELSLQTVSSLRPEHYDFPRGAYALHDDQREVTVQGAMLFPYSQAEGSQPLSVKLLASLVNAEGEATIINMLGRHELSVRVHADVERYRARGPAAPQAIEKLHSGLEQFVPAERDQNRGDELEVVEALVAFMERQLRTPSFKAVVREAVFESALKLDLDIRFEGRDDVYEQVRTGAGRVDCLVLGVPVELKVFAGGDLEAFVQESLPQASQYVVSQSRRAGFLVILDCSERAEPTPLPVNDVQVRQGVTGTGLDETLDGIIAVAVLVVRAQTTVPSQLRTPNGSGEA